jgi:hypothetical protein
MVRWSIVVLTLAALLVAAGCGLAPVASDADPSQAPSLPPASDPAGASHPAPAADGLPWCRDIPMISAPAAAYGDSPIYVGNEQPTEALRAWAMTKPGFEEIWIDREHHGWVTVAFSEGAAERQAELQAAFPGVGVVAVEVEHAAAELAALQRRVHEILPPDIAGGSSAMVHYGVVEIMVGIATPERIAAVEAAFAGQPVCIAGTDPAEAPAPGPQRPAGDGWRLLATEETGQPYRTGIAFDEGSLEALWALSGVAAPLPAIDWQREVVIWFGAVYGGGCPHLRLDDVVVDGARRIVHAQIVLPDPPAGCDDSANPRAFLVALERSRLPAPPFAIQLTAEDPPGGVPEERTLVDADLRVPGSIAGPEQVHGDPRLPLPDFVESGDVIETGFPAQYRMSVHCGVEWLGELNGVWWRTLVPNGTGDFLPPAWAQGVAMDESIVLEVLMSEGPLPIVEVTANGHTVVYRPATEDPPGCD